MLRLRSIDEYMQIKTAPPLALLYGGISGGCGYTVRTRWSLAEGAHGGGIWRFEPWQEVEEAKKQHRRGEKAESKTSAGLWAEERAQTV